MKLNVNIPNHPYDIVIEKGTLAKLENGWQVYGQLKRSLSSQIIMWQVCMLKRLNVA